MKANEAVEACKNAAAALEQLGIAMEEVFKVTQPKQPELPKRWEDLEYIKGYYVDSGAELCFWDKEDDDELEETEKNIFATREQAEAAIALAQLSQLREV